MLSGGCYVYINSAESFRGDNIKFGSFVAVFVQMRVFSLVFSNSMVNLFSVSFIQIVNRPL